MRAGRQACRFNLAPHQMDEFEEWLVITTRVACAEQIIFATMILSVVEFFRAGCVGVDHHLRMVSYD
jgi:hypothetical protein